MLENQSDITLQIEQLQLRVDRLELFIKGLKKRAQGNLRLALLFDDLINGEISEEDLPIDQLSELITSKVILPLKHKIRDLKLLERQQFLKF